MGAEAEAVVAEEAAAEAEVVALPRTPPASGRQNRSTSFTNSERVEGMISTSRSGFKLKEARLSMIFTIGQAIYS